MKKKIVSWVLCFYAVNRCQGVFDSSKGLAVLAPEAGLRHVGARGPRPAGCMRVQRDTIYSPAATRDPRTHHRSTLQKNTGRSPKSSDCFGEGGKRDFEGKGEGDENKQVGNQSMGISFRCPQASLAQVSGVQVA